MVMTAARNQLILTLRPDLRFSSDLEQGILLHTRIQSLPLGAQPAGIQRALEILSEGGATETPLGRAVKQLDGLSVFLTQ